MSLYHTFVIPSSYFLASHEYPVDALSPTSNIPQRRFSVARVLTKHSQRVTERSQCTHSSLRTDSEHAQLRAGTEHAQSGHRVGTGCQNAAGAARWRRPAGGRPGWLVVVVAE